jgi:hypothetical protein
VTWWAWTLLWLVLVLAGAGFLFLVARRLLRQGAALARELSEAADVLARVGEQLEDLGAAPSPGASAAARRSSTGATAPGGGGRPQSQDVR